MSILNVEHLTHGFGDRAIFNDVSFRLLKGEHIGLVGANGEGKSTFMSIVTGKMLPDEGKVEWSKNVHAGYLDQHAVLEKGMTIRQALKSAFDPLLQKEQRMNEICDMLGTADEEEMNALMEELGTIQDELTLHDFYTIDAKVEEVARALGLLDLGLDRDVTDLSGGQRTKVLLAKLLLEKPDILLLDEPTNYLDEEHIAWLKRYLLDYDSYSKTDLSTFSDRSEISNWAMPYVRAMVGADYIHGRGKVLAPLDNITRAEFAQIFHNIIGSYITVKGIYGKEIKGSVLIRTDEVTLQNMTVDGDLIIGCGAADGKITLDNVTVKGRLLVWGGGVAAIYCNNETNMPAVVVARVDDAVKVIYDRDSTLAVIDTIKTRITERAKQNKETEIIFYDVSGLREAQKQLNAIVAGSQLSVVAPAHLYAIVGATDVKAEFTNNSKSDTYKIEIRRNKDNTLIADTFELAAGKSISSLTLLETPEFGNVDCTVIVTAFRDGKEIGTLNTELTLHVAYLWPKEVQ